jgi:hypothetical protein
MIMLELFNCLYTLLQATIMNANKHDSLKACIFLSWGHHFWHKCQLNFLEGNIFSLQRYRYKTVFEEKHSNVTMTLNFKQLKNKYTDEIEYRLVQSFYDFLRVSSVC